MNANGIDIAQDKLADFCRHNGIRRLFVFGSALTERFTATSDVDLLVEFAPDRRIGYIGMAALERELAPLFGGRKIDLRTPGDLSPYFRQSVVESAALQYPAE
jgi:predicted nucleotidyltransferase